MKRKGSTLIQIQSPKESLSIRSSLGESLFRTNSPTVDLNSGQAELEHIKERRILKELNYLHINGPRSVWTYVSDLYALILGFLAVTGLKRNMADSFGDYYSDCFPPDLSLNAFFHLTKTG